MVIDFLHLELQYEEMEFVMTGETARRDLQQHLPVVIHDAIGDELLLITCSPSFYREGFQTIAKSENSYSLHQKEEEKTKSLPFRWNSFRRSICKKSKQVDENADKQWNTIFNVFAI